MAMMKTGHVITAFAKQPVIPPTMPQDSHRQMSARLYRKNDHAIRSGRSMWQANEYPIIL